MGRDPLAGREHLRIEAGVAPAPGSRSPSRAGATPGSCRKGWKPNAIGTGSSPVGMTVVAIVSAGPASLASNVDPVRERERGDQRVVRGEVERGREHPAVLGRLVALDAPALHAREQAVHGQAAVVEAQRRRVRVDHDLPAGERETPARQPVRPRIEERDAHRLALARRRRLRLPADRAAPPRGAAASTPTIPAPGTNSASSSAAGAARVTRSRTARGLPATARSSSSAASAERLPPRRAGRRAPRTPRPSRRRARGPRAGARPRSARARRRGPPRGTRRGGAARGATREIPPVAPPATMPDGEARRPEDHAGDGAGERPSAVRLPITSPPRRCRRSGRRRCRARRGGRAGGARRTRSRGSRVRRRSRARTSA